jgi:hypothetical protein
VSELALILSAICAARVAFSHGAGVVAGAAAVLRIGELGAVPRGLEELISAMIRCGSEY